MHMQGRKDALERHLVEREGSTCSGLRGKQKQKWRGAWNKGWEGVRIRKVM